ncbi:MAG: FHA domain-containing protein, partial [Armatimonadota bacterium]
ITDQDRAAVPDAPSAPAAPGPPHATPAGRVYPGLSDSAAAPPTQPGAFALKEPKGGLALIRRSTTWQNAVAGIVGGFLAWLVLEPFVGELGPSTLYEGNIWLGAALAGIAIGGMIGCALGCSEGVWTRNARKALLWGAIGLGVGTIGGVIGGLLAEVIFQSIGRVGGPDLVLITLGRAIAWLALGLFVGTGQGIALRAGKKILNGLIGGAVGGFVGGALFQVVAVVMGVVLSRLGGDVFEAWPSRLIGFMTLGLACGAAIGIVEQMRKHAWLTIVQGPFAGKEFIIYRQVTRIGSDPACDITIFKDPAVAPVHARIELTGNRYVVRDAAGLGTTYLNGRPITEHPLRSGDFIQVGATIIQYADRALPVEQLQHAPYRFGR